MSLNLSETKSKKSFPRIEEGTFAARVVRIIDMGKQVATDFKTGEPKTYDDGNVVIQNRVWIDFEFPTETIEIDGVAKPRWQGKEYTVSSHEKAAIMALMKAADPSGKLTMKWRNVSALLGLPLMVSIGSTSSNKPKITNVASLMKGMTVPDLANPTLFFDLDGDDVATFESLPEWLQKRIKDGVDFDSTNFFKKCNSFEDMEESPY